MVSPLASISLKVVRVGIDTTNVRSVRPAVILSSWRSEYIRAYWLKPERSDPVRASAASMWKDTLRTTTATAILPHLLPSLTRRLWGGADCVPTSGKARKHSGQNDWSSL